MANWMIRLGEGYIAVIYDYLHTLLYDYHVIQADVSYMVMKQIQAIYREEGKLKSLESGERLAQQLAIIQPLVEALFTYLKMHKQEVPKNGKLHEAFTYALNQ